MKNLISVIVPIYKVEKYLRECVDSLLCQTYTNLEIILVDDGSPDNCPVICDEYAVKDSRVKVVHKENGGVQSAIKCGVKSSQCEYVAFVDGDDYVSEDYIENLVCPLVDNDYDLVMSGFNTDTNGIIKSIQIDKTGEQIIDSEYLKNLLQIQPTENVKITNSRCGKLFKRELLLSVIDLVDERIFIGEDMLTINAYATKCKRVFETGKNTYFYRMVETSSTHTFSEKKCLNHLLFMENVYKVFGNSGIENIERQINTHILNGAIVCIKDAIWGGFSSKIIKEIFYHKAIKRATSNYEESYFTKKYDNIAIQSMKKQNYYKLYWLNCALKLKKLLKRI